MSDMPEDVRTTLMQALGIAELPAEEQERLMAGFAEVALKAATMAVLEKLPQDKREEFARLAEAGEPVALATFLNKEVPGHEALAGQAVAHEAGLFKESLIASA